MIKIERSVERWKRVLKKKGAAKIVSPLDAESRARELIKNKNPHVMSRILFKRTSRDDDFWLLEGEALLRRLHFFKVRKSFQLKIGEDGELMSYDES